MLSALTCICAVLMKVLSSFTFYEITKLFKLCESVFHMKHHAGFIFSRTLFKVRKSMLQNTCKECKLFAGLSMTRIQFRNDWYGFSDYSAKGLLGFSKSKVLWMYDMSAILKRLKKCRKFFFHA